jgi:hypothetical protein
MRYSTSYADLCLKMREHLCFCHCNFFNLSITSIAAVLENVSLTKGYRKEPPLPIDFEKERTGHCKEKKLSLLVDHIMTKYIIVIWRYHLHRQFLKEIVKIVQCIQKLQASQKHYSHCSKGRCSGP